MTVSLLAVSKCVGWFQNWLIESRIIARIDEKVVAFLWAKTFEKKLLLKALLKGRVVLRYGLSSVRSYCHAQDKREALYGVDKFVSLKISFSQIFVEIVSNLPLLLVFLARFTESLHSEMV